jgi:hypothetical protein
MSQENYCEEHKQPFVSFMGFMKCPTCNYNQGCHHGQRQPNHATHTSVNLIDLLKRIEQLEDYIKMEDRITASNVLCRLDDLEADNKHHAELIQVLVDHMDYEIEQEDNCTDNEAKAVIIIR